MIDRFTDSRYRLARLLDRHVRRWGPAGIDSATEWTVIVGAALLLAAAMVHW